MNKSETQVQEYKPANTSSLSATITENGMIVLIIYINIRKPGGWTKRELRKSCFGVWPNSFTFDFIKGHIKECYSLFPDEEINELLKGIRI